MIETMNPMIIYHSHTGTTRGLAERVHAACGGNLVEVRLKGDPSAPVAYVAGVFRSLVHAHTPIQPDAIDVSDADVVVMGTPVWGHRPTPAIRAAADALEGAAGKPVVLFATCGGSAGETLPILAEILGAKGMTVADQVVFDTESVQDPAQIRALVDAVEAAGP
ncbi:MAG: flavodoxin family protein [Methanomicrobiales archaeon]